MELTEEIAHQFAQIALGHVAQEYPNKLDHVMDGDGDVQSPRALHPVFFGSYDWHSCVHSWWTLLTLLRLYPNMPEARAIQKLAESTFTAEALAVELDYLERPGSKGFERPYGWGWLLFLHHEAARHADQQWGELLEPLARAFAKRLRDHLPLLTYPITVGTHFNTSFALILSREWGKKRDPDLVKQIDNWAQQVYGNKCNYAGWEPGGDEFLSPVLTAALLMSKVMPHSEIVPWFDQLVLANGWVERECEPVIVSDRSDGKIAHLDGLNLSRAWCLRGINRALGANPASSLIEKRSDAHLNAALPHVAGDYMGEHWLASFALLALLEGY